MFSIKSTMLSAIEPIYQRFLAKRMPMKNKQILGSKSIFILPSAFGFSYLLFIVLLFILGTNYQNNIILLLSYLLVSFFITAMLHSFFNLSGIVLSVQEKEYSGFAEQHFSVYIDIESNKERFDIHFQFKGQSASHLSQIIQGNSRCKIPYYQLIRGIYQPGRLKISSYYGFGLFVTWSQIDLGYTATVYPKASPFNTNKYIQRALAAKNIHSEITSSYSVNNGVDEFYELKPYQQGESYNHVAWKQLAKGQGWLSKKYTEQTDNNHCLILADMPASQIEKKIEQLCFLILEHHRIGTNFSVNLIHETIAQGHGELHLNTCLKSLSAFENHAGENKIARTTKGDN